MSFNAYIELKGSVELGGALSVQENIQAEAVAKINAVIPDGSVDKEVDLAPVTREGIVFLLIKPSQYDDGTGKLKYKVGADLTEFKLDAPHVFRGPGQAAMLPVDPSNLKFSNALGVDVTVEILVFWNTTIG